MLILLLLLSVTCLSSELTEKTIGTELEGNSNGHRMEEVIQKRDMPQGTCFGYNTGPLFCRFGLRQCSHGSCPARDLPCPCEYNPYSKESEHGELGDKKKYGDNPAQEDKRQHMVPSVQIDVPQGIPDGISGASPQKAATSASLSAHPLGQCVSRGSGLYCFYKNRKCSNKKNVCTFRKEPCLCAFHPFGQATMQLKHSRAVERRDKLIGICQGGKKLLCYSNRRICSNRNICFTKREACQCDFDPHDLSKTIPAGRRGKQFKPLPSGDQKQPTGVCQQKNDGQVRCFYFHRQCSKREDICSESNAACQCDVDPYARQSVNREQGGGSAEEQRPHAKQKRDAAGTGSDPKETESERVEKSKKLGNPAKGGNSRKPLGICKKTNEFTISCVYQKRKCSNNPDTCPASDLVCECEFDPYSPEFAGRSTWRQKLPMKMEQGSKESLEDTEQTKELKPPLGHCRMDNSKAKGGLMCFHRSRKCSNRLNICTTKGQSCQCDIDPYNDLSWEKKHKENLVPSPASVKRKKLSPAIAKRAAYDISLWTATHGAFQSSNGKAHRSLELDAYNKPLEGQQSQVKKSSSIEKRDLPVGECRKTRDGRIACFWGKFRCAMKSQEICPQAGMQCPCDWDMTWRNPQLKEDKPIRICKGGVGTRLLRCYIGGKVCSPRTEICTQRESSCRCDYNPFKFPAPGRMQTPVSPKAAEKKAHFEERKPFSLTGDQITSAPGSLGKLHLVYSEEPRDRETPLSPGGLGRTKPVPKRRNESGYPLSVKKKAGEEHTNIE